MLADQAIKAQMQGVELIGGTPEDFKAFVSARFADMKDIAKAANLAPQ